MATSAMTDRLAYLIASVNRRLEEDLAARLRPGGVPIEQYRILEALRQHERLAMGELAALVLVEPATLTKIIDRMVAEALVFRMPDARDRRRVNIALAPAGAALLARLAGIGEAQERELEAMLDADRAGALKSLLLELRER